MDTVLFSAEGGRVPPSWIQKKLQAFDPDLRISWGMSIGLPFAGWIVERRIPDHMKAKVYGDPKKSANRERYSHQIILDEHGNRIPRRFDMMPDWHFIYKVENEAGQPILELGEFLVDYLRRNYERTLMGFPELSTRHHREDVAAREAVVLKFRKRVNEEIAEKVMDHRFEVFGDVMDRSGQPAQVMEGTEL